MSIPVSDFLTRVNEIATEGPKYRLGGYGKDGTCDCIGLSIGAIRRAGGVWKGTHGSNYAARYEIDGLTRTSLETIYPGMQVFKAREKGHARWSLPGRYAGHKDQRDYYHAGVVTSVNPLCITHSTGTGLPSSIKEDTALGAWEWGGRLKKVGYDEAAMPGNAGADTGNAAEAVAPSPVVTAAVIHTQNGRPLNIRAKPTKTCGLYWKLPCGAPVDVL